MVFRINQTVINQEIGKSTAKDNLGSQLPVVYNEFKKMTWNVIDEVGKWNVYKMGQWTKHINKWSSTMERTYTTKYSRGNILMVDFGSFNYGFEFSYEHPAVVLVERKQHLLVVPGSTKKYNSPFPEYIDASPSDGFARNTGLLLEQMRWIHKNRVVTNTGQTASQSVLNAIEEYVLNYVELHKIRIAHKNKELRQLRALNFNLNQQVQQQATQLTQLQGEFGHLNESYIQLKNHNENLQKKINNISGVLQLLQAMKMDPQIVDELKKLSTELENLEEAQ